MLYTSQATACNDEGEALALQIQANYGGVSRFLRLWILSEDCVAASQEVLERTVADYVPNETSLESLVRDARRWAKENRSSILIGDRRMLAIILSPGFELGVFDVASGKHKIIDSKEGSLLHKPMQSFPDDTAVVVGTQGLFENRAIPFHSESPSIACKEIQDMVERASATGPVGLLHIRAAIPDGNGVRSGVSAIQSSQGLVKDANEDSATVMSLSHSMAGKSANFRLIAVADGVGGAAHGELASKIASSVAPARICRAMIGTAPRDTREMLDSAFGAAHARVEKVASYTNKPIASTLTLSLVQENALRVAHAGDTRAYEVDPGGARIRRLTNDHRLSQDGVPSHVITRAIGSRNPVPDVSPEVPLHEGSILLICTDGLHDVVEDQEILDVCIASSAPDSLETRLIGLANERGGPDNITVAVHYA